jgi:hypothetical protein
MQQQASIEIDRPIEEVFDYTINKTPEWSLTVVEDEMIEVKPEGVGSTFRCVTEERGRRIVFEGVVTDYQRPTTTTVFLTGKQFNIEATYVFEDLDGRTRVTQHSTIYPKGFAKVAFFLFGWLMKKATCDAVRKELDSLKRLLEEGAGQTEG